MTENFETVQDYAACKLQLFSDSVGLHDIADILPDLNFKRLRSVAEFEVAWSRVLRLIQQRPNAERNNLPIGQPDNLLAFDANTPRLKHRRLEFMPQKIFPEDYVGEAGVWAVLTIDDRSDGRHICFTRRGGRPGITAVRAIERLAGNLYRELGFFCNHSPSAQTYPTVLHFYEHTPSTPDGTAKESFANITMTFQDGIYKNPKWLHYPLLPSKLQSARIGLELIQAMTIAELSC